MPNMPIPTPRASISAYPAAIREVPPIFHYGETRLNPAAIFGFMSALVPADASFAGHVTPFLMATAIVSLTAALSWINIFAPVSASGGGKSAA